MMMVDSISEKKRKENKPIQAGLDGQGYLYPPSQPYEQIACMLNNLVSFQIDMQPPSQQIPGMIGKQLVEECD